MGRRGPKPQPTKLRLLKGNPGKRPLNADEPQPLVVKDLPPPAMLEGEALAKWQTVTAELSDLGMLTATDMDLLTVYCETWADWVDCKQKVRTTSKLLKTAKSDYPYINPYVTMETKARLHLIKMQAELGLTPSARSRVKVIGGGRQKSRLDRFLDTRARVEKRA